MNNMNGRVDIIFITLASQVSFIWMVIDNLIHRLDHVGYAQLDLNADTARSPLAYNITHVNPAERREYSERTPVLFTSNSYRLDTSNSFVNQISIIITSNTLLPQNTYRFKFTVNGAFGNPGFAEIDIFTESVPTSGRLLIHPQNGNPLMTLFSLSAPSWTDNFGDAPLLYQFGLRYIFFNASNSLQLLPSCCSLSYDNNLFSTSNVSCVCDFFSTGVSEQNDLQTTLPFFHQSVNGIFVQVESLLHVFDKNGARTETSQSLDGIFTELAPLDDDYTRPLMPMMDPPVGSEQVDVLAVLDRIRQLSRRNWREALAQLTTLVSCAEVSLYNSPYFSLSSTQIVQFKTRATDIILDIYESHIPLTKPYLSVIARLLQSTSSPFHNHGTIFNDAQISRIIAFVRVLADSFNNFIREQVFSLRGFSTVESQIVLNILQNIISTHNDGSSGSIIRVQANSMTEELLSVIPKLGYGLCTNERYSFVDGAHGTFLKALQSNLPTDYQSTEQCSERVANGRRTKYCLSEDEPKVTVNFSSALFEHYLWWPCGAATEESSSYEESESYCSGVCLTSAQHTQNFLWQGGEYESRLKSLLFQLHLLNPQNGSILLEPSMSTASGSQVRVTRNVPNNSMSIDLSFPILASYSHASNLQCAYWNETSNMWIRKACFTGEMKQRNGTVTDVLCHFEVASGSIFTILEVCPDGYYGEVCSGSKTS